MTNPRKSPFAVAAVELRGTHEHGRLLWSVKGSRCYERTAGGTATLTLLSPAGPPLVYVVEGVELDDLR